MDMELFAMICRIRRGQLLGGFRGKKLVDAGWQWMEAQGICDPEKYAFVFAPARPATQK